MKFIRISCAALAVVLSACGHDDPQAYIPQQVQPSQPMQPPVQNVMPAPVVVQQPSSNDGFLTGMLMGHLMTGGVSRGTTIVEHHYSAPAPQYRAPSYSSSSYRSNSSFRSSSVGRSFGGRR